MGLSLRLVAVEYVNYFTVTSCSDNPILCSTVIVHYIWSQKRGLFGDHRGGHCSEISMADFGKQGMGIGSDRGIIGELEGGMSIALELEPDFVICWT